jgi:4-oxalocrotonate tautomerase
MPHVIVNLYVGRTEEQKVRLTEKIVQDVVAVLSCEEKAVSVAIEDIDGDWMEKIYQPEIAANWDKLYKKPGYGPVD